MNPHRLFNRREFIKVSASAAAGFALASCNTATTPVQRKARRPAAGERINLGLIGFGTMAHYNVANFLGDPRVQVVAVADPVTELPHYGYKGELTGGRLVGQRTVEAHYAEQAKGGFKGCRVYEDFRDMFDKEDLDAVLVSTPDHWHCAIAVLAARRGLHVYGQKPLSLTLAQGRRMANEVAANGIIWQTGSQQRSEVYFRTACEFVRNGRLSKLKGITVGLPGGHKDWSNLASRNKPETPPKELNYDLWLGPCEERPYLPALGQLNWRHNFAFSGGMITDWGAHHLDIVQWALGMDASGPSRIEIRSAEIPDAKEVYNTVSSFDFDVIYANGVRVNVSDKNPNGLRFDGENGASIFVSREALTTTPEGLRREKLRPEEIHLYASKLHERNFIDCIYSGGQTSTPIEVGHRSISIAHITNIALRLGRSAVDWNPATERFVNDVKADALLDRPMRAKYAV